MLSTKNEFLSKYLIMLEKLVISVSRFIMQAYLKVVGMFASFRRVPILINRNSLIRVFIPSYQIGEIGKVKVGGL